MAQPAVSIQKDLTAIDRFFRLLSVDKQDIGYIYLYAIFTGLIQLSLPLGIQAIVNFIQLGQISTSWGILVAFVVGGIALTGILQILQLYIIENLQQKIFTRSSFEFAYRIPRIKLDALRNYYTPELVNRFFDTLNVQKGLSKILVDFSSSVLQIFFGLILLSFYHAFFVFFAVILIFIVYLIFRMTAKPGLQTSIRESSHKYEVAHWLEEVARALGTFKLAGKSDLPMLKTDVLVSNYLNARKSHFRILVWQYSNILLFKTMVAAGLLIMGSILVINQQLNIGQFVAAEIIIILVINSVEKLVLSLETIYDVLTALEKLGTVTDMPLEDDTGTTFDEIDNGSGLTIAINELSFTFPEKREPVLRDVNLQIKSGERVVIAGPSGSGKSTLIQLLGGLYEHYVGSIEMNGLSLKEIDVASFRAHVGDSLGQEDLFKGTLYENITLGRPWITMEEVMWAVDRVRLDKALPTFEKGLQSPIDPMGERLSRSVQKKIILARSIVGKPRLLILEEALFFLDQEDQDCVVSCLLDRENPWTVIAVSNKRSLAEGADRVVLLSEGTIVAQGTFDQIKKHHLATDLLA